MNFIVNHINQHLMIHFDEIIISARLEIYSYSNSEIPVYQLLIKDQDFLNLPFAVEKGQYTLKIKSISKTETKQILIK